MTGRFEEVVSPERVVLVGAVPDAKGNPVFEVRHTMTFTETGGKTTQTMTAQVIKSTPEAEQFIAGMEAGWTQSLERLATHLSRGGAGGAQSSDTTDPSGRAQLVGDREIVATRIFNVPRELIFKVWTDPQHIAQWWGPRGFVTTTFKMDVKPGGVWRFVMHGPDGRDYENKITYLEVVEPERLVYKHGGDADTEPVNFKVTVTLDAPERNKTKLTMRMQFPSAAARDFVVTTYGAVDGLTETLGRLGEKLATTGTPGEAFVISRVFDAPRDLVFKAWTERERLVKWWGPKGFVVEQANLDLRPGGKFHYCMRMPDGGEMWGMFRYREILPPQRLVWVNSFSDPQGNLTRHPMSPDWPRDMLTTVTFAEHEGRTTVMVQFAPIDATADENKIFDSGRDSMRGGWGGTFEQLAAYLAKA
jgi:uncharacterized protein YndB with AHSA1/START domain